MTKGRGLMTSWDGCQVKRGREKTKAEGDVGAFERHQKTAPYGRDAAKKGEEFIWRKNAKQAGSGGFSG